MAKFANAMCRDVGQHGELIETDLCWILEDAKGLHISS